MNDEQIDALEAGKELNILIAKHVFGFEIYKQGDKVGLGQGIGGFTYIDRDGDGEDDWAEVVGPDYSGTWYGAGLVLDRLHEQGWEIDMVLGQDDPGFDPCECFIMRPDWKLDDRICGHALILPLAICRAALKAVQP